MTPTVLKVRKYQKKVAPLNREFMDFVKEEAGCHDCGEYYPSYVMDYDHVRGKKMFNISKARSGQRNFMAMVREILKCEVVCANCHRERTHNRGYPRVGSACVGQ